MNKEIKNKLFQIIITIICLIVAVYINNTNNLPIWGTLLLFLIPYLIAGGNIIKEAGESLINGELLDEDFLMSVATIGALAIGFLPNTEPKFAEAVFVMLFFQVGELFEEIAEDNSQKSIENLLEIRPDYANIEVNNKIKKVNPEEVHINDTIIIKPGEKIPLDGIIVEGKTSLNTNALTGESMPIDVGEGNTINSGCINLTSVIKVKVTKEFKDSTASKIIDSVKNAIDNKSKSEKFITKFSKYYTPIVVAIALILSIIPPLIWGNFSKWLVRSLTFLVVSCPCALVVSVPLAFFGGIGGASKKGILIKGSNHLENLSKIKTVVFDKTGTLTQGVFEVTAVHPEIYDEEKLLHLSAHVERFSTHPIAVSLKKAYRNEDDNCKIIETEEIIGKGIKAKVNNDTVCVGNSKMMDELGIKWKKCNHVGTIVHVAINEEYFGHIVISDKIKNESASAINDLESNNIRTVMFTGDHEDVAKAVADKLNINKYYSEMLPQDKSEMLEKEKKNTEKGEAVAFVGDGINDVPVLAKADVGITMGVIGSDASIEVSDVVIMDDKVSSILKAIKISKRTMRIAKENIAFSIAIKIIVLILATFGYAPMWLAVFADVGVTVLAVINSMRTLIN